jgi:predicted DNA-binding protein
MGNSEVYKMLSNAQHEKVRLNIQVSVDLTDRLSQASSRLGKNVSVLVRESIEEKLRQLETQIFKEQMKAAYQGLAEENARICEDFRFSDPKNLPEVVS